MPKITEMFAFVATDQNDEDEGIMGFQCQGTFMPMVGADMARVNSLKKMADSIAKTTGKTYRILRFTHREDITSQI